MTPSALKNPSELPARMALSDARSLLLVDVPQALEAVLADARPAGSRVDVVSSRSLRSVKDRFAAIVVWREDRVGSRALFDAAVKRLEPDGVLWVAVAMKKVIGPQTPAVHRLEPSDLDKAFAGDGLIRDREVRVSAWHAAYRFVRRQRAAK